MTPAAKWEVKRQLHPYNAAKRAVAGDIAAYKARWVLLHGKVL